MSYDEILNLITLIDQGDLDSQLTPAQMEELSDIMCALADKGSDPTDPMNALLLQEDIYALQCGMRSDFQDTFFNESHDLFAVIPVAYYGKAQGLICKEGDFQYAFSNKYHDSFSVIPALCHGKSGWISKKCRSLKDFVKKHKKAIIIGAVVVVAVVAVTAAVVIAASAEAVAVVTAAGAAAREACSSSGSSCSSGSETSQISANPSDGYQFEKHPYEDPVLEATVNEQIASFKEFLIEDKLGQSANSPN